MSSKQETLKGASGYHIGVGGSGSLWISLRKVTDKFGITEAPAHVKTQTKNAVNLDGGIVENHPLIPVYGRFRDDPTWDRFMQNIEDYNAQVDAIERATE